MAEFCVENRRESDLNNRFTYGLNGDHNRRAIVVSEPTLDELQTDRLLTLGASRHVRFYGPLHRSVAGREHDVRHLAVARDGTRFVCGFFEGEH